MHELSIAIALVEQAKKVAEREHAAQIRAISVSLGVLSGVEADALQFAFPFASEGTPLAGVPLHLEQEPLKIECSQCNAHTDSETIQVQCPVCGSGAVQLTGGREIKITSMEIEDNV